MDRAKELAKNQELGQVVIHKKDMTIQTEHTHLRQGPVSTQGIRISKAMEAALNNEDSKTFPAEDRQLLKQP